ncbi:TPA: FAD-dependent oxidoreductase [Candidatus Saccharibacteria bacterium]|nr:FAD-dependent oxidoreductase [Candidatus Saccharibacteria bacterium]HIO87310.1 FAD-dependent oxidoreductase [Candidatus Saccharibacteria bacterium]
MKITDFKGLKNTHHIQVVDVWKQEDKLVVEMAAGDITWRPGEHAVFSMPGRNVEGKKWRAFSIASVPSEGVIRIGTKISSPSSSFKQELQKLKKGDHVKMRGPFGWFYRQDETTPVIMVAAGIGITPILAMVKQYQEDPTKSDVHVIYSSDGEYLFKEMLDTAAKSNPKLSVSYVKDSKQVNNELTELNKKYDSQAYFFISGAPSMIKSLSKTIKGFGVKKSRIIADPYLGY